MTITSVGERSGLHHEALFYPSESEYLAGTVPFVVEGIEASEPVVALVPKPRLGALRTALDGPQARVMFERSHRWLDRGRIEDPLVESRVVPDGNIIHQRGPECAT
jgi:MEDS: MEthanogen/methylotroph, DcmR Sensory domain